MSKPKVAIYDLTDCEGCEVALVALKEKILDLVKKVDIINWRLAQENNKPGPFDVTIIEGTPVTQAEIDQLKELRKQSKVLIALGACACLAGVPGIMDKADRQEWYDKIYGKEYKPKGIDALPLSAYVKADFLIHGCPVSTDEVARILEELLSGKTPAYRGYSVCFDCKEAGNNCRIIDKKACLGPITQGGCRAVCVASGAPCYGCYGFREDANILAHIKTLKKTDDANDLDRYYSMFLKQTLEYKNIIKPTLKAKKK